MKHLLQIPIFIAGLLVAATQTMASSDVDHMSDIEVCEYAVRMSEVMEKIQARQLCVSQDTRCVRAEFSRYGVSYDDKKPLQKRLSLMVGSIH